MSIQVITKGKQAFGSFNNGDIIENKPIGFPQDGGEIKAYSNIFYWAHAHSERGSTIGLHPHRGFEIVSYVLKGTIKHYDTKTDKWLSLDEGSFQVIKSGKGISHSEEICAESAIFQIWFDPNINKSQYKDAEYKDYQSSSLPVESQKSIDIKTIVGEKSPVNLDTEEISIREISLKKNHILPLETKSIYSIYIIHGKIILNGQIVNKDDFAIIEDENQLTISVDRLSKIFIIASPKTPSYKTCINS